MITVLAFIGFSACGQADKNVPEKVKTAFAKKFENAKKVKWDKENETEWEAEFKMDGKKYSANFDLDGNWMETEYEIKKADIPAVVQATLDADFLGYKVEEAEVSETTDGKFYEFEIEKGKTEKEITIDESGKIVKDDAQSEDEGEEDDD